MFKVGDKVVYPMQGAGIIQGIEKMEFSEKCQKYYIIEILTNNLKIMIPSDKIANSNLRLIEDEDTLDHTLSDFNQKKPQVKENLSYKQRYQINMEKIRSGSLEENIEVVYDLTHIKKKKKNLNSTEKEILIHAKKFLVDEISLIKEITPKEATTLLNKTIN